MEQHPSASAESASEWIDAKIRALGDWRGETLARLRALIREADPEVVEEWKWRGTPVWSHHGLICTGETYKHVVKMTFAKGASWPTLRASSMPASKATPAALSTFTKATRRTNALKALIRAAVAFNQASRRKHATGDGR